MPCGVFLGYSMSFIVLWISLLPGLLALDNVIDECRKKNPDPLGLQSKQIPDSAITASSNYDPSVGPENARIRTETNGGAWCPKQQVSKDVYEYLQVDLGDLKVVTLVETQGRFGNGQGQEFADQYLLEYQREPGGEWFRFRNRRGQEIFQGNTNTYIAELRVLDPPIIARWMRFIPYSVHPKTVCMRVELYGCVWKDGTVQYNMPQGERRGTEVDLYDFTYDGKIKDGFLSGGLGQLTDGEEGQSNFRLDPQGLGIKGYEWVGFREETFDPNPVELVFKFDAVRNFSSVRIYTNNMFSKDVRVFKKASIWFSIGGKYYREEPLQFKYMRDTLIEFSRQVIISLQSRKGQYVKILLHFDSKWLLISEVQFESDYAVGNFSEESPPVPTRSPSAGVSSFPNIVEIDVIPGSKTKNISGGVANGREPAVNVGGEASGDPSKDSDGQGNAQTKESIGDEYIGIIIGTLAALILILFAIILFIILRQRRRKYNKNHRAMKSVEPRDVRSHVNGLENSTLESTGKEVDGNTYNFVRQGDMDTERDGICCAKVDDTDLYSERMQTRRLPELPRTPESTDTNSSREYAVPDLGNIFNQCINTGTRAPERQVPGALPRPGTGTLPRPPQPDLYPGGNAPLGMPPPTYNIALHEGRALTPVLNNINSAYASCDVTNMSDIQGVSGSNVYACSRNTDLLWKELNIREFPRESLNLVEKLGEGQFGEVHLCDVVGMLELLGDDCFVNRTAGQSTMLAAVKMLRHNADDKARTDFQKEVKIMSKLKDPNIVRVLGVCSQDDPLCVVVEYMKFGDLNQYLQTLTLDGGTMTRKRSMRSGRSISHGSLIYMATQIASGMKYLESLNMVHRDLATRNCLVGHNYSIKISDFGMSRSLYSSDYYRIEGRAVLPIRWMAWESILLGNFSTKTDVWSFGVTLWEVLTFAKLQPYDTMTDEMVIDNCGHYYRNDGLEAYLTQPQYCPRELYDLMRECWNRDDLQRPTFHDVHMFLLRKNIGYNPRDEKQTLSKPSKSVV